jgi:hypothetical protein
MAEQVIHGVVRTDLMHGTDNRADLVSLWPVTAAFERTGVDNGMVVAVGGFVPGEREIRYGLPANPTDPVSTLALVATPEVMYDERDRNLSDFTNTDDGRPALGYRLRPGDVFSITDAVLANAATAAVGNPVYVTAGGPVLEVGASLPGNTVQVGVLDAIEQAGRYKFYVIRVV